MSYWDWLRRYRVLTDIRTVFQKLERGEKVTIGFIGGSITQGFSASKKRFSYPHLIYEWFAEKYAESNINIVNASLGGTQSDLAAFRLKKDLLFYKPDLVFVEFSANDFFETYYQISYEGLITELIDNNICVHPIIMFNKTGFAGDGVNAAGRLHKEVLDYYRIQYTDTLTAENGSLFHNHETFFADEVHPNDRGHRKIADFVYSWLNRHHKSYENGMRGVKVYAPKKYFHLAGNRFKNLDFIYADELYKISNPNWNWMFLNHEFFGDLMISTDSKSVLEFSFDGTNIQPVIVQGPLNKSSFDLTVDGQQTEKIYSHRPDFTWGESRMVYRNTYYNRKPLQRNADIECDSEGVKIFGIGIYRQ